MTDTATAPVRWLTRLSEIEALEPQWRALEVAVQDRTVFSRYDWVIPWYRHYGGRRGTPLVGVIERDGELVAVAPLVYWNGTLGGVPVRRVDFAGHNAEAGEFLVRDAEPALIARFIDTLAEAVPFDVVRLHNLDPDSPKLQAVRGAALGRGFGVELSTKHYITVDISKGFDAYFASTSAKFRSNLRRYQKRIASLGASRIDRFRSPSTDGLDAVLARVFAIADASWKAKESGPMTQDHRGFYDEVARRFAMHGMLDLSILTIGDQDASFLYALVERERYYDFTISFSDAFRMVSPGTILMIEMLKQLPADGIRTVFSHGDHEYKRHWATHYVPQAQVCLFARSVRGRASQLSEFRVIPALSRLRQSKSTVAGD